MKNVRINLIKRTEVRYQGIVSPKFLVVTFGSALLAALVLLIVVRSVQYSYRKRHIEDARKTWADLEPRYKRLKEIRAELAHENAVLTELKARQARGARWSDFLLMLQRTAPENIQLGRLHLEHVSMADGSQSSGMSIRGWSQGDGAEAAVIGWRKLLLGNSVYTNQFDSLDLGHLRLAGAVSEGSGLRRSFEFVGERQVSGSGGQK